MGPNSKVIINGDISQIDLPNHQTSGLIDAMNVLKKVKRIDFIELDSTDVVRHKIVKDIIDAYEKKGKARSRKDKG